MLIDCSATVLVTGATGFLGRALLHRLSQRGCRIKVLARPGSEVQTLTHNYGAELVHGDIMSPTAVGNACEETTHVFHLAGRGQSNITGHSATETRRVNVDGTKLLAHCIAQLAARPRVVHLSTAAVHGDIKNGPGDEGSPFNASTTYELTKLEAELWLRNFADRAGIPLTVLRPCAIVGPGDRRLLKLFRLANRHWIPIIGPGDHRYQIIHVDDCVEVLLAAGERESAAGKTLVCGNPETLRLRELLEFISPEHSRIFCLPKAPPRYAISAVEKLCLRLHKRPPLSVSRLGFFSDNHWFDTSAMKTHLNVQFEHNNQTALATTRNWYMEQGLLKRRR